METAFKAVSAARTLRGGKPRNCDAVLADERGVYVVADGIDSRPFGDYYARLGCIAVRDALLHDECRGPCLAYANGAVHTARMQVRERQGGSCLAFASLLKFPTAQVGCAGDVRVLLWRRGELADLLEGAYDNRSAAGTEGFCARYNEFQIQAGDRLLLCSDGMWNAAGAERIARALEPDASPQEALCRCMVGLAYADSASAVLVCV